MPDASQLFTNKPFSNEDNANKFLINSSRSDCITKKINKRIKKDKKKRQQIRKKKDNNKYRQKNKETIKKSKKKE